MKTIGNFVFFWKSPLGQWNMQPFVDNNGIIYNCAEQYMMAKKALLFDDLVSYGKIMASQLPSDQQDLGRLVSNFNQEIWEANATLIVYQGNYYKFSQHKNLMDILQSTKGKLLVEASPYDVVWGIGYGEKDDEAILTDKTKWRGKNLLGYTLTSLRDNAF